MSAARAPRGDEAARRRPSERPVVLVAEDEPELRRLTHRALELAGYEVRDAADGVTALALASDPAVALVILDVTLPGLDGLTLCRRLRERSDVSILMVTALSHEEDIVRGLDAGADDYLGKPFAVDELIARTRAVLRRAAPLRRSTRGQYVHGDLTVDLATRHVAVAGRAVALTRTEYALLAALVAAPGRLHTHYELLDRVWERGEAGDRHVLEVTIGRLRRKLEPHPTRPVHVLTSPRAGYLVPSGE